MEELVGYGIGCALVVALIVAVVIAIGYILLWATGITVSVGAVSGLALALKAPYIYLSHLWRRRG